MHDNPAAAPPRPLTDDELAQARATWESGVNELELEASQLESAEFDVAMHVLGMYSCCYGLTYAELELEVRRIRREVGPCVECSRLVEYDQAAGDYRHLTGPACAMALEARQ